MAHQLDLEEQEQLDQLKHFWAQYGGLISGILTVILVALLAWNGYQWWTRNQSLKAAAMYDTVEQVVQGGDLAKAEQAFNDMKERFASTAYTPQAGLLVGKMAVDAGKLDSAKTVLAWVADKSGDKGLQAVAKLRLSALALEAKNLDEALALVSGDLPAEFAALVADRKGDILSLQGKRAKAIAQYQKAFDALDERNEYRRLVDIKLQALGVNTEKKAEAKA